MQIYITQNGKQLGPFTEAELRAQLAAGTIFPQDLAWWEGQAAWTPVSQTPYASALATTPLPPPGGAMASPAGTHPPIAALTQAKTSGLAIASLVTGILFIFCAWFFLIPVILGHVALSQIKKNPELRGHGMALAGTILGYCQIVLLIGSMLVMHVLRQQVQDVFKNINTQLDQAQSATNSTDNPATNNVPDTNSAPESSNAPATNAVPDTSSAPATSASTSAPDASNSSPTATTNAAPASGGH